METTERSGREITENKTVAQNGDCFVYGDSGTRTRDLCVANASLSQLSYIPKDLR